VEWGVWDIIGLFVAVVPAVLVLVYLFPRKAIDNLKPLQNPLKNEA
jgi:hypothetical protein